MTTRLLIVLVLVLTHQAQASFQSGIGVEMAVGYPQMSAALGSSEARYNGTSVMGQLILPLLDYEGSFSTDLALGYRYSSYRNSASNTNLAEWAELQGFSPGVRFNFNYFFAGTDMIFLDGRHLVAGSTSQIFDYSINPIQAHVGVHIPIGKVISLAASYSQHLVKGQATVNGQDLSINEQLFMITMQVDLGMGFFNVIKDDSTFEIRDDYSFE